MLNHFYYIRWPPLNVTIFIMHVHNCGNVRLYMARTIERPHEISNTVVYVRPAKPQISLPIHTVWSEPLLVAWLFDEYSASDRTSFGVSKLKRRLHRLVRVYTCQNTTLLEITHRGSIKPYKPSSLFVGHQQTAQNQIRCHKMQHLIRFSTVCKQKFLLKFK